MRSRFPGMDPYLEGADWLDFHYSFIYVMKRQLASQLRPRYYARSVKYMVTDTEPELVIAVQPDTSIVTEGANTSHPVLTPPTATYPCFLKLEINVPVIEIREKENDKIITTIHFNSPPNKRNPGYNKFIEKQEKLHKRGVNLIEIDLIRQGKRRVKHPLAQSSHYLVTLLRAGNIHLNIWAVDIKDKLPIIPVPLKAPDADAVLDLQRAFNELYEEGGYANSINYRKPPPPPAFSEEEQKWVDGILGNK